jgi:site-specific recombinase XerD
VLIVPSIVLHASSGPQQQSPVYLCTPRLFWRLESAGLPVEKRHPHVLKHSLASHLVAGNANLALVRQALGHRSINSTMQYVGTSDSQAAEALQKALMGLF